MQNVRGDSSGFCHGLIFVNEAQKDTHTRHTCHCILPGQFSQSARLSTVHESRKRSHSCCSSCSSQSSQGVWVRRRFSGVNSLRTSPFLPQSLEEAASRLDGLCIHGSNRKAFRKQRAERAERDRCAQKNCEKSFRAENHSFGGLHPYDARPHKRFLWAVGLNTGDNLARR